MIESSVPGGSAPRLHARWPARANPRAARPGPDAKPSCAVEVWHDAQIAPAELRVIKPVGVAEVGFQPRQERVGLASRLRFHVRLQKTLSALEEVQLAESPGDGFELGVDNVLDHTQLGPRSRNGGQHRRRGPDVFDVFEDDRAVENGGFGVYQRRDLTARIGTCKASARCTGINSSGKRASNATPFSRSDILTFWA